MFSCVEWISIFEYARFGFMGCYACCIKCIVIERFLAIANLSTYENHEYAWVTILCIASQIVVGTLGFTCLYYSEFLYY